MLFEKCVICNVLVKCLLWFVITRCIVDQIRQYGNSERREALGVNCPGIRNEPHFEAEPVSSFLTVLTTRIVHTNVFVQNQILLLENEIRRILMGFYGK